MNGVSGQDAVAVHGAFVSHPGSSSSLSQLFRGKGRRDTGGEGRKEGKKERRKPLVCRPLFAKGAIRSQLANKGKRRGEKREKVSPPD